MKIPPEIQDFTRRIRRGSGSSARVAPFQSNGRAMLNGGLGPIHGSRCRILPLTGSRRSSTALASR